MLLHGLVALVFSLPLCVARVDFTYATILDEYDLTGVNEVSLDSCKTGGCSIYVSVSDESKESTNNLHVVCPQSNLDVSLYDYATKYNANSNTKIGLHISSTSCSIKNSNGQNKIGPIVIYIVGSQAPYYNDDHVEFYDASHMIRPATQKSYTVIMSPSPFNLFVQSYGTNLKAYVRATGFDNNIARDSSDNCQILYDHDQGVPFRLHVNSPIITIAFESQFQTQICATPSNANSEYLDYAGMGTSQGYIGCQKNDFQVYRSSAYKSSVFTLQDMNNADRNGEIRYAVRTNNDDKVTFNIYNSMGTKTFDAYGQGAIAESRTDLMNKVEVVLNSGYGSSYWVGYKPVSGAVSIASGKGICTDYTEPTTQGVTSTTTKATTTTSGAYGSATLLASTTAFVAALLF